MDIFFKLSSYPEFVLQDIFKHQIQSDAEDVVSDAFDFVLTKYKDKQEKVDELSTKDFVFIISYIETIFTYQYKAHAANVVFNALNCLYLLGNSLGQEKIKTLLLKVTLFNDEQKALVNKIRETYLN